MEQRTCCLALLLSLNTQYLDMIFLITYQNKALLFMKMKLHTQD